MTKSGGWRRLLPALALLLLLTVLLPALASACPLCKEADDGASTGGGVWRGMYWSILLMIGMPFSMLGVMVLMIVRARRRRQPGLLPGARS
jgi:heme/copper-type cytochrome/quinol oxidase subunit 2